MLDFVQYINDNWNVDAAKKIAFLNDFCIQYDYQEEVEDPENPGQMIPNPVSKETFANQKVIAYFKQSVNACRKKIAEDAVTYIELDDDFV